MQRRSLRNLIRGFPFVALLCVGVSVYISLFTGDVMLYSLLNSKCPPCGCNSKGQLVMCPEFLDDVVVKLDLEKKGIASIKRNAFNGLDSVTKLYLGNNGESRVVSTH